ncbi:MAG TPA: YihY/virulence factor BrkB family protein [Thermoanaerobaculia bacterium]|nr:YihY/virulence factor BrkB family protein [Thermoanaerobaculia bacterium]
MTSLWTRGGLSWWQLGRRVWTQMWAQELFGRCAELAYYFLLSIFPLLLFLTTLLGYLAGADGALRASLFDYLDRVSPSAEITGLLHRTLDQVARGRGGAKLSLSLLAALWVASSGILAVARTLNSACGLRETRPWWMRRLVAVAITTAFAAVIVAALAVIFYGEEIGQALANRVGLESTFLFAWHVLKWPLLLLIVLLSFDLVYNFAPSLGGRLRRAWGTPGAVTGVALWLTASFGYRFYLYQARGYSTTYGSLGAVILLLVWFYFTAFAILVGGQVNSEIQQRLAAPRGAARGARAAARGGSRRRPQRRRPRAVDRPHHP